MSAFALLITEGGVLLSVMGYMLFTQLDLAIVAILAFIPQAIATPMVQKHINLQSAEQIGLVRSVGDDALAEKQEHPIMGSVTLDVWRWFSILAIADRYFMSINLALM